DAAVVARDHAQLADRLAHQEDAADVQVHHLVRRFQRMLFGRRAPGGAGVVDEDVDLPQALQRFTGDTLNFFGLAHVGRDPARVDALGLQVCRRLFEIAGLARAQQNLRARFTERLGDLQPEAARAAGDERRLALEV